LAPRDLIGTMTDHNEQSAKTVLFDMDGTLVDTAPDLVASLNSVLSQNGFQTVEERLAKTMIGYGAGAMISEGLKVLGETVSASQLADMEAAFDAYYDINFAEQCRVFDGIEACLKKLSEENTRLAVCTNTGEALAKKILNALDLEKWFHAISGGDTFETKKPDAAPILKTIEAVSGTRDRAIMVGDSKTDVLAARAASIPVIAVTYGYSKEPIETHSPDFIASSGWDILSFATR